MTDPTTPPPAGDTTALRQAAELLRRHADSILEGRPANPAVLRAAARAIEDHLVAEHDLARAAD